MNGLFIALKVVYVIICVVLVAIVLMQEGKNAGLGTIGGVAETYWGKNKSRSIEGKLVLITRILAVAFIGLSILLNMGFWTK